jgi:hypothetical protein
MHFSGIWSYFEAFRDKITVGSFSKKKKEEGQPPLRGALAAFSAGRRGHWSYFDSF